MANLNCVYLSVSCNTSSGVPKIVIMSKKAKRFIYLSFASLLLFSGWAILNKPLTGGPCNAGIDFFLIAPLFLIITILQFGFLNHAITAITKVGFSWVIFSASLTTMWIFIIYFYYDEGLKSIMYLFPFLLLNSLVTLFLYLYKPVSTLSHKFHS